MKTFIYSKYISIITIILSLFYFAGCEEEKEPVTSSEFMITVNSLNQSDIGENGIIEKDENISNHSGNPWGEFIDNAFAQCGNDPVGFQILDVSVQMVPDDGIEGFEELVSGTVNAYFLNTQHSDLEADRVVIGSKNSISGLGPVDLENLASRNDLVLLNSRLIGGDFHVGFNAETNLSKDDSFSFDINIRFRVKAYCE